MESVQREVLVGGLRRRDPRDAAVNVAARVEQLTKTTGDAILLTQQTVDALESGLPGLTDRGSHALKGKSTAVQVFALDPAVGVTARTW
jgi:class 3 adenylate cyclase